MKAILTLTLLALLNGSNQATLPQERTDQHNERKHMRFPGSRMSLQGEVWLTWVFPVREWFVESALSGYEAGYDKGCQDGKSSSVRVRSGKTSADVCSNGHKPHGKAMFYAEQMTEFYTLYPEDRDLPLAYLVQMLICAKPKTLYEIHQWVSDSGK